jgi:hypothetical protein
MIRPSVCKISVSLGQPTCTASGNHSAHGVSDGTTTGATVVLVLVGGSVVGGIVVVTGFRVTVGLGWVGAETGAPLAAVAQAVSTAAHSTAAILTRLPCCGWCDCCCSWWFPLFD